MIRVLIVDDSVTLRRSLCAAMERARGITVVGEAADAYEARDQILALKPDVITLDVEMPGMDGLTFLSKLMKQHPLPVVMLGANVGQGSATAIRALEEGAVSVISKPTSREEAPRVLRALAEAIRGAASARNLQGRSLDDLTRTAFRTRDDLSGAKRGILAVGASTGGTRAIEAFLGQLSADVPGTVITQHMPAGFTEPFAKRLNDKCPMEVREAQGSTPLRRGLALVAPGGKHLVIRGGPGQYVAQVRGGPLVHHQRPAVDVLFHSVARCAGSDAVGVLLTGMGADGAVGMMAMRSAGARTLAQDEESCVVFGMPRKAIELGAAEEIVPLDRMGMAVGKALLSSPDAPRATGS
jgi:two-component system, chemotaxis family, protein-glutamate methylesterase/glutaminase